MEPEDLLNYANDPTITSKIGNELIYYSGKIEKYKFGKLGFFSHFQKRNLLITNIAIYNFKDNEIKRRIKIEDLYGITYSSTSNQFAVHFNENDYDYLFQSENRDKIIALLQNLYVKLKNQDILFCVKKDKELTKYIITKKERKKNPYAFKFDKNELTPIRDFLDGVDTGDSNQEFNQGYEEEDNNEKNNQEQYQEQEQEPEPPKFKPPQMPHYAQPPPKPVARPPPPKQVSKPPPAPPTVQVPDAPTIVVTGSSKGVPPPPPPPTPPPPPPPPPKVPISNKSSAKKPVDLAAELASKKNNLKHVEVKDYVSPALNNQEDSGGGTTNSMMAAIMAQRNKMKKAPGGPTTTNTAKQKPAAFSKPATTTSSTIAKPGLKPVPKPAPKTTVSTNTAFKPNNPPKTTITNPPSKTVTTAPKKTVPTAPKKTIDPPPKPPTTTVSKPPPKMTTSSKPPPKPPVKTVGGGGGGGFAARMAALQAKMAGPSGGSSSSSSSTTTSAPKGPSKPIVELCKGNTKKMDINKVINNLEKEKKKQASKVSSKPEQIKIVANKGAGIPPPPPPPPPPKLK